MQFNFIYERTPKKTSQMNCQNYQPLLLVIIHHTCDVQDENKPISILYKFYFILKTQIMGKKVFNAKARQSHKTTIDNSEVKKIKLELGDSIATASGYDDANPLVLPSQKRKTKTKPEIIQHTKILTKKQRKRLQTIVDKKRKKEERASILEGLEKVKISPDELSLYQSISQVQTIGLKNFGNFDAIQEKQKRKKEQKQQEDAAGRVSSIAGINKRKRLELLKGYNDADESNSDGETQAKKKNPNVIGLEGDLSSSSDEGGEKEEGPKDDEVLPEIKKEPVVIEKETKIPEKPKVSSKPAVFIPVNRDPEIQTARLRLPILAEEQTIMEIINENSIIIVAGETGSGKTTQIPQFLYESGYGQHKMIGITEPRRVAAISMSKRVAHEMNLSEKEVSYLIRFEGNVTEQTKIKFMTDGVLLKEIESDFMLQKYSVIILDEAHERSAYTDILIGLLSRIVPLRVKRGNPLKLIIMSATLKVEDFLENSKLFRLPPPLIKVEARQFPVTIHFQKTTVDNYVEEAYKKTMKIHSKLPEGGILVFVTGQQEVNYLVRKLRKMFPYKPAVEDKPLTSSSAETKEDSPEKEVDIEDDDEFDMKKAIKNVKKSKKKFVSQISLPKINLDDYKLPSDDTEADLHEDIDEAEEDIDEENEESDDEDVGEELRTSQPLWVLPLYSLLSSEKQSRIFRPPPEGCRLCIVSTNVAETSLTIPNIKYVVDSGRQKTRLYDKITGVSAFVVTFTSKASADQRAGRAGRTSAGHCYRLYSSAVYNDEFESFSTPDIQKKPVDDLMMQMRCMGIDRVINFPFPSPPDAVQLQAAESRLIVLGALGPKHNPEDPKCVPPVTKLGHVISRFPVAPRFGKMLALSHQQNMLPYTVCLVAALSVQELLIEVGGNKEKDDGNKWHPRRQSWASTGNFELLGDPMVLLRAVGAAEYAGSKGELLTFCNENGIRHKAITEVRKLRVQLTNEINLNMANVDLCVDPEMVPPTDKQAKFLRQILLAGMGDRVARKVPLDDINDKEQKRKMKNAYNCLEMEEPVFMHSSSILKKKQPTWVIYQEAYETRSGDSTKLFIRGVTAIEPEWLLLYVPRLCNIRSIKEDPLPKYNSDEGKVYCFVDATFGKAAWEIPLAEVEMPLSEKACCYFGMFFLNGDVFPKLQDFKAKLKVTPSSITKSWSNLNENVTKFKRALFIKEIHCRQALLDEWEKDPNYLMQQYCDLLFEVTMSDLVHIWPPIENA
ncbi:probable ATP-dependent RNA helicase kurz [Episyrphus balteatus]|uniref:probable ATP-dependent RNA helicase kurz n=1 Tax=Episyrphus balteatus TaxID=286459 RepID=UPI0024865456|nr:probable ATP-dependent RNA helicase kurz [Episyrphus balteatus]